jgi:hypothetical protein
MVWMGMGWFWPSLFWKLCDHTLCPSAPLWSYFVILLFNLMGSLAYKFNTRKSGANNFESQVYVHFCLQPYYIIYLVITLCISFYFLHLLSTNHNCTQPYNFPLLYKPAAHKVKVNWNSSTSSCRLCAAPVVVLVVSWSLPLFCFTRESS